MTTTTKQEEKAIVKYCSIDKLFYIYRNEEPIHAQTKKPTEPEIIEALNSDNWQQVFKQMANGERVRVSIRIYFDMLGVVPPIKYHNGSFYVGEPYSGRLHHFFEREHDGKYYGQLKEL
jgi:hypothetical protein